MHWYNILSLLALAGAIFQYSRRGRRNSKGLPFPPGPKGYPLIGNLFDYPTTFAWTQYDRWSKKYGDLLYFEVLGQPFLILGSLKRTNDLFEKRSKNYSDRIWSPMVMDLMGCDFNFGLLPYGAPWRKRRRQFHEHFNSSVSSQYIPIQADEVKTFLRSLLDSPENLLQHIRRSFAGTIMRIVYDIHVDSLDNEHALRAQAAIDSLSEAAVPGAFLVDFIPALKYVPSWFPGAGFRAKAENWRKINDDVRRIPFALVKEQHRNNSMQSSVASTIIKSLPAEDDPSYQHEECVAQDVTAVAFAAGADTTVSSVHAFFCAMAMYPETMRQAQDEIDRVVGADRLPNIEDQASLPFVRAVCKEILRWHNVIPLGVPHLTTNDDVYDGYFIPKGTLVFANVWGILHNPNTFEKPFEFMPSRYIKDGEFDPTVLDPFVAGAFGFGRRVCPGRYLASNSLFLTVSNILAVYDILPPIGVDGNPEQLSYKTTSGLLAYPLPFNCRLKPRNHRAEELINSS